MSRVESGTFRLSMGPVDLRPLVEGALEAVLPGRAGRDLEVSVEVAPDVEVIQGDRDQLDRVLINLALQRHQVHARRRPGAGDASPPTGPRW